jgi:hypothetical protein
LRRPRSFDGESLKPRGWSFDSSAASTAPLPSIRSFTGLLAESPGIPGDGIGGWRRGRGASEGKGEDKKPFGFPVFQDENAEGAHGIADVLESVQAVVEFIAGRLAKMSRDEVTNGAEGGLLLPVKDSEREPAGVVAEGC